MAVTFACRLVRSSLTSVHHLETTPPRFECQTKCQQLLHARYHDERMAVFDALAYTDDPDLERRSMNICRCCRFPSVYVQDDGTPSVHLSRCRDRLCPLCSNARSRESSSRVHAIVQSMDAPRFMTLTMPHSSDPLAFQLGVLMESFRALRNEPEWKKTVKGGVWSLELTFNKERSEWHPHIHIIFDGYYFPQPTLKALWSAIHGENVIVDVRAVSSAKVAASYIAKYVSKVVDLEQWGEEQIVEYAEAMHRRRTIHTFGSCHGRTAEADPDDAGPPPSTKTVGVWVIRLRMRRGDEEARRAAVALASSGGAIALLLSKDVPAAALISGDELREARRRAGDWLRELDPETAALWKPPPVSDARPKTPRIPDRALTDDPWHRPEPSRQ